MKHERVKALHGSENPPPGWNGKSYACHRLAEGATGEWLLFTDADTVHFPGSIGDGIARAQGLNVDLLSIFTRQTTGSWSERVIVPFLLDFLPLLGLDLAALWRGDADLTAANGQYILIRAAAYHAIGGHRADYSAMVDDFALAKRVRSNGYKVALVDGTDMVRCRMYHNAREVWQGFSKNLLLGITTSASEKPSLWGSLLFAWSYACLFIIPFFHSLFRSQRKLALLEIGWLAVLRGMVNWRFGRPLSEIPATPLAAWSVMALGLGVLARQRSGKAVEWKGRSYPL